MKQLVECVPNFSEGRDMAVIDRITAEIEATDNVKLVDVDPGAATNRTVVTFIGTPDGVKEAAFRAIAKARELIDMSKHTGGHPRMGATDVCPFVPVSGISMDRCADIAREVGERVGRELGIPVYLYENAASKEEWSNLATVRSGEYEALEEKMSDPGWKPDFGPHEWNESIKRSGATAMGAREFLIAYNVNLNTIYPKSATDIALEIKEAGRNRRDARGRFIRDANGVPLKRPGRLKHVKAIGWFIEEYNTAQISINLTNYKETPFHRVYEVTREEAGKRGLLVTGSEVVGLIPRKAIIDAGVFYLQKQGKSHAVPEEELVRVAVRSMGLDSVAPFDPVKKIVEYQFLEPDPLASMTVKGFVNEVSVESPAPGGGSVAALSGALGAALTSMVGNLTTGKRKWRAMEPLMIDTAAKAQDIRARLLRAVDDDTNAFNEVIDAMRMPKQSGEEVAARDRALEEGYKHAASVPLDTVKACMEIFPLAKLIATDGNASSVSDAAVAALQADAGVKGAILNVKINLGNIADARFVKTLRTNLDKYWRESTAHLEEILTIVEGRM